MWDNFPTTFRPKHRNCILSDTNFINIQQFCKLHRMFQPQLHKLFGWGINSTVTIGKTGKCTDFDFDPLKLQEFLSIMSAIAIWNKNQIINSAINIIICNVRSYENKFHFFWTLKIHFILLEKTYMVKDAAP